jgi:type VI secretion system secreted protein VgrG
MPETTPCFTQDNRFIQVSTPPGMQKDDLLLEKASITEGLSELFQYSLDLLAVDNTKVKFDSILGANLTVTMVLHDGTSRYFHGIVNRFIQANPVSSRNGVVSFFRYQAQVVPQVWLLTRTVRSRVFQQKTVLEILSTVFTGYQTNPQCKGTYKARDYCVQYQESDFDFAARLMEEEGIFYFFTHDQSGCTMQLLDSTSSLSDITGDDSKVCYRQQCRDLNEDEVVIQWNKSQEIRSGKYTLRDRNFELTSNLEASDVLGTSVTAGTVTHQLQVNNNSALEQFEFPGGYATRFDNTNLTGGAQASVLNEVFADSTRVAELRMQCEAFPAVAISAVGTCRRFSAGAKFTLDDHFDANGAYYLTRVTHLASVTEAYLGGSTEAIEYANKFECAPSEVAFRPVRSTPKPRIEGAQTAIVVGQQGDEIFTDTYGRVKVQFYWDRDSTNDPNSSCWVRVGSIWAGQNWGAIHIPRVGHEVIVTFLDGDPDRPIIVGSVYNDVNKPPFTLPDNKTQSGIVSRSSLQGTTDNFNELRFEDKKGSELVFFHAEKDFQREVENNDTLTVGMEGSSSLADGSQTTTIYKDRTTTIKTGNEALTVDKGNRTVTVTTGNDTHDVKTGNRTVTVDTGNDTHDVKTGNRTVTVDTGNDTHTLKMGDRTVTLNLGNDSLTLDVGNQTVELKLGNQSTKCDLGSSTTEALQGITLKSGPSSIQVTPVGVTIKGMFVDIEAQVMCTVKGTIVEVNADALLMAKGGITMIG